MDAAGLGRFWVPARKWRAPNQIRPLNVIKQVLVRALALGGVETIRHSASLRKFVMNPGEEYLPIHDKVYVYHSIKRQPRLKAGMVIMNVETGSSSYVRAEIALPPFGYTVSDTLKGMQIYGILNRVMPNYPVRQVRLR